MIMPYHIIRFVIYKSAPYYITIGAFTYMFLSYPVGPIIYNGPYYIHNRGYHIYDMAYYILGPYLCVIALIKYNTDVLYNMIQYGLLYIRAIFV